MGGGGVGGGGGGHEKLYPVLKGGGAQTSFGPAPIL